MNKGKLGYALLFVVICIGINWTFGFVLTPPSYVRLGLHAINSEKNKYNYIFIGTSHGQYGISPDKVDSVTGKKSINLCMANQEPIDTYYVLKEALRKQKPEKIIYEIDPSYWTTTRDGLPNVFIYKEMKWSRNKLEYLNAKLVSKDFRATLFPWIYYRDYYRNIKNHLTVKLSTDYKEHKTSTVNLPLCIYKEDGFLYRMYNEGDNKGTYNNIPWNESKVQPEALKYFKKMVKLCKKEKIEFEMIVTPVPKDTIANMPKSFQESELYFTKLAQKERILFYDFNKLSEEKLDRSMYGYWDYDGHMYGEFAEKFSIQLGQHLKK